MNTRSRTLCYTENANKRSKRSYSGRICNETCNQDVEPSNENAFQNDESGHNHEEHDVEGGFKKNRKGRGIAKKESFKSKDGKPMTVEWNDYGQAIGENGQKLRRALGYYAKQSRLWPLDKNWNEIDDSSFVDTWKLLKEDFEVEGSETFCFEVIHKGLRTWRHHIKKVWSKHEGNIQKVMEDASIDSRIDPKQLDNMVAIWSHPDTVAKSEINKQNRAQKVFNHQSGAKSIAKIREYLKRKYGREPTTIEVLKVLYPSDDIADNIEAQIAEIQEKEVNPESTRPLRDIEEDAYTRVMQPAKSGYVHNIGIGHDICPKRSISTKINGEKQPNSEKESIRELKEQLAAQNAKLDAQDAYMAKQNATLENVNQQLQQVGQFMSLLFASTWQQGTNMCRATSSSLSGCGTNGSDSTTQFGALGGSNRIGGASNIWNPLGGFGGNSSIPLLTQQFPFNLFSNQNQNFAFPQNVIGDRTNTPPNLSSQQGANTSPSSSPSPSNLPNSREPRSSDG